MKTDDLVSLLATNAPPVRPHASARRHAIALVAGAVVSTILMAAWLGVRRDMATAILLPMFWVKLAFPVLVAAASLAAATRLARPGARLGHVPVAIALPVLAMWALGAVVLLRAAPAEHHLLLFGLSSRTCPFNIAVLSVPLFAGAFWAMKGLAPTRLVLAGAAAGLLAGSLGAAVYSLHCPEMAPPFLGIWYLLGMLAPAAAGAVAGPRLLRW